MGNDNSFPSFQTGAMAKESKIPANIDPALVESGDGGEKVAKKSMQSGKEAFSKTLANLDVAPSSGQANSPAAATPVVPANEAASSPAAQTSTSVYRKRETDLLNSAKRAQILAEYKEKRKRKGSVGKSSRELLDDERRTKNARKRESSVVTTTRADRDRRRREAEYEKERQKNLKLLEDRRNAGAKERQEAKRREEEAKLTASMEATRQEVARIEAERRREEAEKRKAAEAQRKSEADALLAEDTEEVEQEEILQLRADGEDMDFLGSGGEKRGRSGSSSSSTVERRKSPKLDGNMDEFEAQEPGLAPPTEERVEGAASLERQASEAAAALTASTAGEAATGADGGHAAERTYKPGDALYCKNCKGRDRTSAGWPRRASPWSRRRGQMLHAREAGRPALPRLGTNTR